MDFTQERGLDLDEELYQDEEIKYSAVRRDVDSSRFTLQAPHVVLIQLSDYPSSVRN